jgi:hypothetical protein
VLVICLLLLVVGPSESAEMLSWVLAFGVAIPCGLVLADLQDRKLADAAPTATSWAIASGTALLAYGFLLRHSGSGDRLHHVLLAVCAASALTVPFLAAREWRDPEDRAIGASRSVIAVALAALALLCLPAAALRPGSLIPALALAGVALYALHSGSGKSLPPEARLTLDVILCSVLALLVIQLPDLKTYTPNLVHHQGFFLGPANDALHGRAMLAGAWSQYGVGLIDALALTFVVVPIGYGTLSLIIVTLTVAQYVCVYVTLRIAGVGQLLTTLILFVAAAGNLFAPIDAYPVFPSASPLRFGLPYAIVLAAVVGARLPGQARRMHFAMLAVLAIAATWSFETFVYCAVTYGAVVLVEALVADGAFLGRLARQAALALAISAASLLLFSSLTLALEGSLAWGPYLEYLRLYSSQGFGQLPVELYSAGPLMAAVIFTSATSLLWLARDRPWTVSAPMRAALAGLTGLAIATFTYYLGRSHPNNLLVLLVPTVALGGLWTQVLLREPLRPWRVAVAGALLASGATIAIAAWPSIERKWSDTALDLALPSREGALRLVVKRIAANPVFDSRAPAAAKLLDRLPAGEPAAVLTEPALTTEILIRAKRRNLLPISDPTEDALIDSSVDRVRATGERLPPGTLLLVSPASVGAGEFAPTGLARKFNALQVLALSILRRRFEFHPVERTPDGIELVRLVTRSAAH